MYQPWGKDSGADDIIKLIEEKERKEVNYSSYGNDSRNWNIVSYKELGGVTERSEPTKHEAEQKTPGEHWRGQAALKAPESSSHGGSIQPAVMPIKTWGSKIADALNRQYRTEIDVELTVKKRSKIHTSPQRYKQKRARSRSPSLPRVKIPQRRSRSRSQSLPKVKKPQRRSRSRSRSLPRNKKLQRRSRSRSRSLPKVKKLQRRSRSRSRSLPRNKKLQRRSRSRSHSRSKKRRSRSRSISRDRKRSISRDRKRERSDSRDRKRRRSRDRKANSSVRCRSRSRSFERKRDSRSPRIRSPTPKAPEKPAENTNEILSKFLNMMQDVKKEQPAPSAPSAPPTPPAKTIPNPYVLPEFDSSNNGHSIVSWLLRIDDIARLFEWDDKETIQHALPKLVGDAKTWYQTLETVPYTWAEWRKTLKQQFPGPSFSKLLFDMCKRRANRNETLEKYFYDKILLVNRCGLKGRHAVDCILNGIGVETIRLCADAADFSDPEDVLKYLKSVETVWLEQKPSKFIKPTETELATQNALKRRNMTCFRCGKQGHTDAVCWTKIRNSNADTTNTPFNKKAQTASELPQPCEIQQLALPQCQPQPPQSQPQPPQSQSQPPQFQPQPPQSQPQPPQPQPQPPQPQPQPPQSQPQPPQSQPQPPQPQPQLPQSQPQPHQSQPPQFQPPPPQFHPQPPRFHPRPPQFPLKPRHKPRQFQSTPPCQPPPTNKPDKLAKDKKTRLCFHCRVAGHMAYQCPTKKKHKLMASKSTDSVITVTETSAETPITPLTDDSWTEPAPPGVD